MTTPNIDTAIQAVARQLKERQIYDDLQEIADLVGANKMEWEFDNFSPGRTMPTFYLPSITFRHASGIKIKIEPESPALEDAGIDQMISDLDRDYLWISQCREWQRYQQPTVDYLGLALGNIDLQKDYASLERKYHALWIKAEGLVEGLVETLALLGVQHPSSIEVAPPEEKVQEFVTETIAHIDLSDEDRHAFSGFEYDDGLIGVEQMLNELAEEDNDIEMSVSLRQMLERAKEAGIGYLKINE